MTWQLQEVSQSARLKLPATWITFGGKVIFEMADESAKRRYMGISGQNSLPFDIEFICRVNQLICY